MASWNALAARKQLVLDGWKACCIDLFDVLDLEKRLEAVAAVQSNALESAFIPPETDDVNGASEHESESDDELDTSKVRAFGERQSTRARHAPAFDYRLNSQALALTDDD